MSKYFDWQTKLKVWEKARRSDCFTHLPAEWRQDVAGAYMKWSEYGNRDSEFGWEIDHIVPESLGGTDDLSNLQAMHWANNLAKGVKTSTFKPAVGGWNGRNGRPMYPNTEIPTH